jgi:6-phosphogluconolactonase
MYFAAPSIFRKSRTTRCHRGEAQSCSGLGFCSGNAIISVAVRGAKELTRIGRSAFLVLMAIWVTSCGGGNDEGLIPPGEDSTEPLLQGVFVLSNEVNGNEVVFFRRAEDGTLTQAGIFPTGGTGTGAPIVGSQRPLRLTHDNEFLLAVSPRSDHLTAFRVTQDGLEQTDITTTRGQKPVSVAVRDDGLVYVLNLNDGEGSLTGFWLTSDGDLLPIPASDRLLGADPAALPPQVEFSPDGNALVVTERFAEDQGRIATLTIGDQGQLSEPILHPPFGRTPFGMMFRNDGVLIVSEAFAQAPGDPLPAEGKASTFQMLAGGVLEVRSLSVPALGSRSGCVQLGAEGRFAWIANTASNDITTYAVDADGALERLSLTPTGNGPIGLATSVDGEFLYSLDAGDAAITAFRVDEVDGSLAEIQTIASPETAFGILGFEEEPDFAFGDANADGVLSREEFGNVFGGDEDFDELDVNARLDEDRFAGFDDFDIDTSGFLTLPEFNSGLFGDAQDFVDFDTNVDGLLSKDELDSGLDNRFGFIGFDRDDDGFITEEEFGGGILGSDDFTSFDTDIDGLISEDEFDIGIARDDDFLGFDANIDGVISEEEFLVGIEGESDLTGEDFVWLDADANGLLSREEFETELL